MARVAALQGVSFEIEPGEFCAILGPSGSGKSTLLNILGLLDRPSAGVIRLHGEDLSQISQAQSAAIRNRSIGFVFQSFELLPRLAAWENVALPLLYRGISKPNRKGPALDLLREVGLADRAGHKPAELSGGQRQRVAIARALVGQPSLILADEPTGSLDSATASEMMKLFADLNRRLGVTIVMITHDPAIAARCNRRIDILDGRIVGDQRLAVSGSAA